MQATDLERLVREAQALIQQSLCAVREEYSKLQVLHASCRDDLAQQEQGFCERTKNWKALLVHKFPTSTTEADFMRLLGPHGAVTSVKIPNRKKRATQSRAFGFANFETHADAAQALEVREQPGVHVVNRVLLLHLAPCAVGLRALRTKRVNHSARPTHSRTTPKNTPLRV